MSQSAGQSTLLTASATQPSSSGPVVNCTNEAGEVSSEKSTAVSDTVCSKYSALLDGTFFRVVSVADGGAIKAARVSCPAGKKPLSGNLGATTNFLLHLKVSVACAVLIDRLYIIIHHYLMPLKNEIFKER